MTIYPSASNTYWLTISLIGVGLNVALIYMALRSVRYAREEGGVLVSQAANILIRLCLRATTHLINLSLGLISLLTPPAVSSSSPRPGLQALAITFGLFAVQHLLVADAVVDLFGRHIIMRRLLREPAEP